MSDRENLIKLLGGVEFQYTQTHSLMTENVADYLLQHGVTVQRRGRWVMTLYTTTSKRGRVISNKKYACSECGYSNGRKQSDYCPDCGAKMDKEAEICETD